MAFPDRSPSAPITREDLARIMAIRQLQQMAMVDPTVAGNDPSLGLSAGPSPSPGQGTQSLGSMLGLTDPSQNDFFSGAPTEPAEPGGATPAAPGSTTGGRASFEGGAMTTANAGMITDTTDTSREGINPLSENSATNYGNTAFNNSSFTAATPAQTAAFTAAAMAANAPGAPFSGRGGEDREGFATTANQSVIADAPVDTDFTENQGGKGDRADAPSAGRAALAAIGARSGTIPSGFPDDYGDPNSTTFGMPGRGAVVPGNYDPISQGGKFMGFVAPGKPGFNDWTSMLPSTPSLPQTARSTPQPQQSLPQTARSTPATPTPAQSTPAMTTPGATPGAVGFGYGGGGFGEQSPGGYSSGHGSTAGYGAGYSGSGEMGNTQGAQGFTAGDPSGMGSSGSSGGGAVGGFGGGAEGTGPGSGADPGGGVG